MTFDLADTHTALRGGGLGIEGQIDWPIGEHWHVGPRIGGMLAELDTSVVMAGIRARTDHVSFGVDGVYAIGPVEPAGVLVGFGVEGKTGTVIAATEGGVVMFVALVALLVATAH